MFMFLIQSSVLGCKSWRPVACYRTPHPHEPATLQWKKSSHTHAFPQNELKVSRCKRRRVCEATPSCNKKLREEIPERLYVVILNILRPRGTQKTKPFRSSSRNCAENVMFIGTFAKSWWNALFLLSRAYFHNELERSNYMCSFQQSPSESPSWEAILLGGLGKGHVDSGVFHKGSVETVLQTRVNCEPHIVN